MTVELQSTKDKLLAMEEDAGVAFRSKIRSLERQLADANAKVCMCNFTCTVHVIIMCMYMHILCLCLLFVILDYFHDRRSV